MFLYEAATGGLVLHFSCGPERRAPIGSSTFVHTLRRDVRFALYGVRQPARRRHVVLSTAPRARSFHAQTMFQRERVWGPEPGHVYPISDIASQATNRTFLDASPNSHNVFFRSADHFFPQDTSDDVVVYNARVGRRNSPGGASHHHHVNNSDSCKPQPAPLSNVFGTTASAECSRAPET